MHVSFYLFFLNGKIEFAFFEKPRAIAILNVEGGRVCLTRRKITLVGVTMNLAALQRNPTRVALL